MAGNSRTPPQLSKRHFVSMTIKCMISLKHVKNKRTFDNMQMLTLLLCSTQVKMKLAGSPGFPEEGSTGFLSCQATSHITPILLLLCCVVKVLVQNFIFGFGDFINQMY